MIGVHALAIYGKGDRTVITDCNVYNQGNDTPSLWNGESGRRNAGQATPSAALETMLWSAANGELETLARVLVLDSDAANKATDFFRKLPADLRQQYPTLQHLTAYWMPLEALRKVRSMQVLEVEKLSSNEVSLHLLQADISDEDRRYEWSKKLTRNGSAWTWPVDAASMNSALRVLTKKLGVSSPPR